ncbi:MAG: tight adherence protein [Acidimicrobiaceae bacterium]|nr:tight adherence protein [Acidimicrobiaceae bacterium]
MTALGVVAAAVLATAGVLAIGIAVFRPPALAPRRDRRERVERLGDVSAGWSWRLPVAAAAGAAMWAATGWPAAGVWAAVLVGWVPSLARRGAQRRAEVARVEALARFAAMMRDQVLVGADVAQAIQGCVRMAPAPIAPAVERLAARLQVKDAGEALAAFADELDDEMAEVLAVGLRFALTRRSRRLADLFAEVARATSAHAATRRKIETERRRLRTVVWGALVAVLGWMVLIYVVSGKYLDPYGTAGGQVVMLLAGGAFAAGLVLLSRMDRIGAPTPLRLRGHSVAAP